MKQVLVDSNVILDVLKPDSKWKAWSEEALVKLADTSILVINPIVYAEVSVGYRTKEELAQAIPRDEYEYRNLPWDAAFLAGKSYVTYRKRRRTKQSPLPDFFIGAHAAVEKVALLTRDPRRYRNYFPTVELICPDAV